MLLKSLAVFAAFAAGSSAELSSDLETRALSIAQWVAKERAISLSGALNNIGGFNSGLVPGAEPGIVVASPSTFNPNYFYTWTRDSALTYTMIVDELILGNTSLQTTVEDYTKAQAQLQTVSNPSGSFWPAGQGLGEPKFYTNLTRFNGDWGRPQRDGPALRAIVFINLCYALVELNRTQAAVDVYWPLILNDLKYVGQYWNNTGYDLWEEVHGNSIFTMASQHRALSSGMFLAEKLNQTCEPCQQASSILCFMEANYWNTTGGYLTADVNVNNVNRSGINNDPLLAAIHTFDATASCDAPGFQPCNSKVLATHKVFVDVFRNLYPINKNKTTGGVLVGRYPEDIYYDGNPWYICTLACAEVLYDAAAQIGAAGKVMVDSISLPFFKQIYPSAKEAVYTGAALKQIVGALRAYGDEFVAAVEQYTPVNGSLSEQINKTTGVPTSAYDLTWSFASFVTMAQRRSGQFPIPWGAMNVTNSTGTCTTGNYSATKNYIPAKAAGAPMVQEQCETEVLFTVNATTSFVSLSPSSIPPYMGAFYMSSSFSLSSSFSFPLPSPI